MIDLHEKYAPILHFNKGENFFPMRVDDLLTYSSLHQKDQAEPLVPAGQLTPASLAKAGPAAETFVRSVEQGPLLGRDVLHDWQEDAVEMVLRWAENTESSWTEELAARAYGWLRPGAPLPSFWWNDLLASALQGALKTAAEDDSLPRLTLPLATRTNAVERYRSTFKQQPAYTYYYRYLKGSQYLYLQYWFFYSYNDWGRGFSGLNDHEGDWEGLMLYFQLDAQGQPQEPPAYVVFAKHEGSEALTWNDAKLKRQGTHVEGFVGAGSHATYPSAQNHPILTGYKLFDFATGDGDTVDHDQWVHRVNLEQASWLNQFQGSWGTSFWLSTQQAKTVAQLVFSATPLGGLIGLSGQAREFKLPGVSAPRGPVGAHREQNTNPLIWAGLASA